jgi:hypothetical protein
MRRTILILIPIVIVAVAMYWWFFARNTGQPTNVANTPAQNQPFAPFGSTGTPAQTGNTGANNSNPPATGISNKPVIQNATSLPKLRHLSATPIGGFMATTTASSTIARYIDRGSGHIFEASSLTGDLPEISNTTIPKVYESFWNKNASAAVLRYTKDGTEDITNLYAEIRPVKTNASSTEATLPFEVKGKILSSSIKEIAVSPKGDRIFTF